jgi:uncharacterized protein (TIGR02147 family)
MKSIYSFTEYRKFLAHCLEEKRRTMPAFSLRMLAGRVGASPSTIVRILKGQRTLSVPMALKLAGALKLSKRETDYFQLLVLYCHSRKQEERAAFLEKIMRMRRTFVKALETDQYRYFQRWYHVALKELINIHPDIGDPSALGKLLVPAVAAQDIAAALDNLQQLGLIRKNEKGGFDLIDKFVGTQEGWQSVAVGNFQTAMMRLGLEAFDRISRDKRDISTLTVSVSEKGLGTIKERLRDFRKELLEIVGNDTGVNQVYQINFQVFPLSRSNGGCNGA